jgi:hypothetical protein
MMMGVILGFMLVSVHVSSSHCPHDCLTFLFKTQDAFNINRATLGNERYHQTIPMSVELLAFDDLICL